MEQRFCFEELEKDIQDKLKSESKNIEGLYWYWYDIKGNIIGDMLYL